MPAKSTWRLQRFPKLRFRPATGRQEYGVFNKIQFGECFLKSSFSVTTKTPSMCGCEPKVDKKDGFSNISGYVWTGPWLSCNGVMLSYRHRVCVCRCTTNTVLSALEKGRVLPKGTLLSRVHGKKLQENMCILSR